MRDILVSVILPAFNAGNYIAESIDSIVHQTHTALEIIIVNDGSTDLTEEIIHSIKDSRIIYLKNPINLGLIATLNKGLSLAQGKYIARMDADDIALPNRIAEQVKHMEHRPTLGLLGTNVLQFGEANTKVRFRSDPFLLKGLLLFQNEFAHPSVMMRREVMIAHHLTYEPDYLHVEDYALWVRFSLVSEVSNLQKTLLKYRVSGGSISQVANRDFHERDLKHMLIHQNSLSNIGIEHSERELRLHRALSAYSPYRFGRKSLFFEGKAWLLRVRDAMDSSGYVPTHTVQEVISYQWYILCGKSSQLGLFSLAQFYFQRDFDVFRVRLSDHFRFIVKCLVKYKRGNAKDLIG